MCFVFLWLAITPVALSEASFLSGPGTELTFVLCPGNFSSGSLLEVGGILLAIRQRLLQEIFGRV